MEQALSAHSGETIGGGRSSKTPIEKRPATPVPREFRSRLRPVILRIHCLMKHRELTLPELPGRYTPALRAALDYIFDNFRPFAIVVSGSIVRGNPDSSSDFDIVVLHDEAWRQRVQKW